MRTKLALLRSFHVAVGFASKVRNLCESAKGAKYESQGQALSGAKRVAPGKYNIH